MLAWLLLIPALWEILYSLRHPWFTEAAFFAHNQSMKWLFVATCAAALGALWRRWEPGKPRLEPLLFGVLALLLWLKYCQWSGFQLPQDTAAVINLLQNWRLESTVLGVRTYLGVHFMPILWLWIPLERLGGPAALFFLQSLAVASAPLAVFLLVRRRSGSNAAALAGFWLVFSSPYFWGLASASLAPQVLLPALFLWTMLAGSKLGWAAMLATVEQAPFSAAGAAIMRGAWRWAAACALLFAAELLVIRSLAPEQGFYSDLFSGGSWFTWARWSPLWTQLWTTGFFPLAVPSQLLPWALTYLPNFLASAGTEYQQLTLHYPAYVAGPLWWAAAEGLSRLWTRRWAPAWTLAVCAACLYHCPVLLMPNWGKAQFSFAGKTLPLVPAEASVWATEWAAARLADRELLKAVPFSESPAFSRLLFKPDYVLIEKDWITLAKPDFRARLDGFLLAETYLIIEDNPGFLLLRHPAAPLPRQPAFLPPP